MKGDMSKEVIVVFCLELKVKIEQFDLDFDDKVMEKLDNHDYERQFMGYFEEGKCKASLRKEIVSFVKMDLKQKSLLIFAENVSINQQKVILW